MPKCEHPNDKQLCIFKGLALERGGMDLRHIHWRELCGALLDYVAGEWIIITAPYTEDEEGNPIVERREAGITLGDIVKMGKEDLKRNARSN